MTAAEGALGKVPDPRPDVTPEGTRTGRAGETCRRKEMTEPEMNETDQRNQRAARETETGPLRRGAILAFSQTDGETEGEDAGGQSQA